jgi:hypothetical protein
VNDDVEVDKGLTSDKPGSPSLSPFFWLRDDEEGGTAESLSESLLLDTPLRHNAPTFSDIKDSDEENHHNMTPNVSSSGHFCFSVCCLKYCAHWIYISCRAKLRIQRSLIVKFLNGAKYLAPLSCVLLQ